MADERDNEGRPARVMPRWYRSDRVGLFVATFVVTYLATITLLTMATNGWYPVLNADFCGSPGDFTAGPVPTVCLSFVSYWSRAAVHPPYVLVGLVVSTLFSSGLVYRWDLVAAGRR